MAPDMSQGDQGPWGIAIGLNREYVDLARLVVNARPDPTLFMSDNPVYRAIARSLDPCPPSSLPRSGSPSNSPGLVYERFQRDMLP